MGSARVVAMVSFAEVLGGAERSLLSLARSLPARGWAPVLLCPAGRLADAAEEAGVRVERLALRRAGPVSRRRNGRKTYSPRAAATRTLASVENALRLASAARRWDAALVHSNSLPSHLPAALAGRLTGRPVIWHLREMISPGPGRSFFSRFGRMASGMVAISSAVAATVSHDDVDTVYNPVDGPPAGVPPPSWDLPSPVLGYLGRLDPHKGIEDLIAGAARTEAHLVVAGRPYAGRADYVASLRDQAERQAPGRVHFVGELDGPWQLLAGVDVLVVPSLAEPFGRVAAEGQRAGVAVVAADAGGLREIVRDERDGLLFPPGDARALADRLHRLLADGDLRERLARAGRASSARFDPDRHADLMAAILTRHAGAAG